MTDNDGNEIDVNELDEDFNELEYEVGFNQGYSISELDPDLALELDQAVKPIHSRANGFVAGIKEFFRFQELQNSREGELDEIRKSSEQSKGRELNR